LLPGPIRIFYMNVSTKFTKLAAWTVRIFYMNLSTKFTNVAAWTVRIFYMNVSTMQKIITVAEARITVTEA